jgi:transcriptional regulator with PAS, ATPase and Fis domain
MIAPAEPSEPDHGAELEPHLAELCELFGALSGRAPIGVALYHTDGRRLTTAGLDALPRRLPAGHRSEAISVGACVAFGRIRSTCQTGLIFAVCSDPSLPSAGLESLCRMGAGFLARTVDLLHQARTLHQVVREQEAIIDHITDGLLVLDRSGVLRYLNAPAGRILGINPRTAIGRVFRDLIDFEPIIGPIFSTGEGYADRELRIHTPRRDLHLIDTAVPIRDKSGQVVSIVNTFREMAQVRRLSNRLAGDRARYRFADVLGTSRVMREAVALGRRAARSDATVLLSGESGTGKEIFAQAIHNDGRRATGPFVAVNCAALPRDLIESEMFGYAPGSFTGADKAGRPGRFEIASGGTIFLDEISEMPLDVQAKLLRVLQERQVTRIGGAESIGVDVRVVAAANRNLQDLVNAQAFRTDLFYRLNVVRIDLPPLRARRDDIEGLIDESLRRCCTALHRPVPALAPRALQQLGAYEWPGNVRQLQNVIERLVNASDADVITEVPIDWLADSRSTPARGGAAPSDGAVLSLDEAERYAIRIALDAVGRNVTRAADLLGISRPTLYAKMKRYGLVLSLQLSDA